MGARLHLALSVLGLVVVGVAHGAENDSVVVADPRATGNEVGSASGRSQGDEGRAAFSSPLELRERLVPVIATSMPDSVARKLRAAFDTAVERVRDAPECAALFSRMGVDGVRMLETTLYIPAHPFNEGSVCQSRAAVFTKVGASQTWVCRNFSSLPEDRAAMSLIHEALHHAGLSEYPLDPHGLRAREINSMVVHACGL